jgi:hypothetical protein
LPFYLLTSEDDCLFTYDFNIFKVKARQMKKEIGTIGLISKRAVFLTQKKARIGEKPFQREIWAGIVPRLKGISPFLKWDIVNDPKVYIEYKCLVEIGNNSLDVVRIQLKGSPQERDVFGSLRGFQLYNKVMITGKLISERKARVQFSFWQCEITDTYDFEYSERLSFDNPDYLKYHDPNAVQPQSKRLRVYHTNAKRLEDAELACPFEIQSNPWIVQDPTIIGPAEIHF